MVEYSVLVNLQRADYIVHVLVLGGAAVSQGGGGVLSR